MWRLKIHGSLCNHSLSSIDVDAHTRDIENSCVVAKAMTNQKLSSRTMRHYNLNLLRSVFHNSQPNWATPWQVFQSQTALMLSLAIRIHDILRPAWGSNHQLFETAFWTFGCSALHFVLGQEGTVNYASDVWLCSLTWSGGRRPSPPQPKVHPDLELQGLWQPLWKHGSSLYDSLHDVVCSMQHAHVVLARATRPSQPYPHMPYRPYAALSFSGHFWDHELGYLAFVGIR